MHLLKFLEKISGSVVHFYPKSGNAGDGFITYATHLIFEKYNISYVAHHQEDYVEDQLVLIGGGGNLVEGKYQDVAELIKKLAPKNKVVVLPHTIVGYADILKETYRNLVVFCREPISYYKTLANGANPENTHLSQDITFYLSDDHFAEFYLPGSGELNVFRSDGESTGLYDRNFSVNDISLSWNGDIWASPKFCEYVTKSLAAYIAPYETVCTDRLHIGILSAFLGKKVRLLPNSYFKNQAIFDHSLSRRFSNVMFEEQKVISPRDSHLGEYYYYQQNFVDKS